MPADTLTHRGVREADVRRALDVVQDPELDEPITDLGFVRSIEIADGAVEVHLRLPTSFCSPSFAYLMTSDAKDALQGLADVSGHLTPRTLELELAKLERNGFPVLLYHLKPAHVSELKRELAALGLPNVRVLRRGEQLTF